MPLIFRFLSLITGVSDKSTSLCSVGQAQEGNLSAPITLMNSRICQVMKPSNFNLKKRQRSSSGIKIQASIDAASAHTQKLANVHSDSYTVTDSLLNKHLKSD